MSESAARFNADEEWEELLREWRPQPEARPRPYFYGRVRARLVNAAAAERPSAQAWLRWPAYAVMLGLLLLLSGDDAALGSVSSANQNSANWLEAPFGGE